LTKREAVRWGGCFEDAAINTTGRAVFGDVVMVTVGDYGGPDSAPAEPGIYRINLGELGAVSLVDQPGYDIEWSGSFYFHVQTNEGLLAISADGEAVTPLNVRAFPPSISREYSYWALRSADQESPGLWVGHARVDQSPTRVFDGSVSFAAWSWDEANLFFFGEGGLYLIQNAYQFNPPELILPDAALPEGAAIWVFPP
jgi:hypothetical protein